MKKLILPLLIIISSLSFANDEKYNDNYFNAKTLREAILHSNWMGYEKLMFVLASIDSEEADKILTELSNYNFGENPEDALAGSMLKRGKRIIPHLKSALKTEVVCQKQVKSYDKIKKLQCKNKASRDKFIKKVMKDIEGK